MNGIEALAAALTEAFQGEVAYHSEMPPQVVAPAVICVPAEEFLSLSTHGAIDEAWDVLVAVSMKSETWFAEMRRFSLRVMRATLGVGARWRGATGPQAIGKPETLTVVSVNRVVFRYPPPEETQQ